jgi:hypothetical protein
MNRFLTSLRTSNLKMCLTSEQVAALSTKSSQRQPTTSNDSTSTKDKEPAVLKNFNSNPYFAKYEHKLKSVYK